MALALEGIRVVEVTTMAAGPMAARLLADWGADVIHVEHPGTGDPWRTWLKKPDGSLFDNEVNYHYWENHNRNKRSITIDIAHDKGREILYKLIERADVFLTNRRPYELKRFKLEYETLRQMNPKLIYGSVTGFGRNGPDSDAPGHDTVAFWARSGFVYLLQQHGAPPPSPGYRTVAAGDNVSGLALACGVLLALFVRDRTGLGQEIDVSLLHTGIFALVPVAMALSTIDKSFVSTAEYEKFIRRERDEVSPLFVSYETKDGRWLQLSLAPPDPYWSGFCKALGKQDLEGDPRFSTLEARIQNQSALFQILEDVFRTKTLVEWRSRLNDTGMLWSPIQSPKEVVADPQARANDVFVRFDHPSFGRLEVVSNPIKLSKTPATIRMPAPEFGQHTEEVLLELGYTWEEIGQFKQEGIVA
jgi:crotonobetainyl-CoA:carnitine CoA-transferase CaiB-like acyl-CoA transferase